METELLADLLFGSARISTGYDFDDDEMTRFIDEAFPGKAFCVVRNWMLIDVMLSDEHERAISKDGLTSTVLYAATIVSRSETNDISQGVLSGFQLRFDGGFFETKGSIYVLAGRGARKFSSVPAVHALARECGVKFMEGYERRLVADFA